MTVYGIHSNFSTVLPIPLKTCIKKKTLDLQVFSPISKTIK